MSNQSLWADGGKRKVWRRKEQVIFQNTSSVEHREESLMVCMVIIDDMTADKSSRMNIWHHFLMTSCLETHRTTAAAR